MQTHQFTKTARTMTRAEGYLQLGMPEQALSELECIEEDGILEAPRQYMIGYARKLRGDFEGAIPAFERAARRMPSPHRRLAWKALSECYRECGSDELADLAASLSVPAAPVSAVKIPIDGMIHVTLRAFRATDLSRP